jgi:Sulfotransferase domain
MTLLERLGLKPKPVEVAARSPAISTRYFFMRGHPRSGTNWVGAILNLHPKIYCHGEFHLEDVRNAIDLLQAKPWQTTGREPVRTILDQSFQAMVRQCLETFREKKPGAMWLGDRTPRGLRPLLADAPVFWVIRDGRDVLVSWTYHVLRQKEHVQEIVIPEPLKASMAPAIEAFRADPHIYARHPERLLENEGWVRFIAKRWGDWMLVDLRNKAAIEAGEFRASVHTVRYETLHAETERERASMYAFLGLDPAEALPLSAEGKTTAGFGREDPLSFYRKGEVGDWRTHFTPEVARWFKESAGQALFEAGYAKDLAW